MKTKLFFLAIVICSFTNAQTDSATQLKKNSIYLELFGNGGLSSINYERLFYQKNKVHFGVRMGIMTHPMAFETIWNLVLPAEINLLLGKKNNFFETGIGNTYNYYQRSHLLGEFGTGGQNYYRSHYIFLRLGYRFQKPNGIFLFRIAFLPVFIYKPRYIADDFSYKPKMGMNWYSITGYGLPKTGYKNEIGIWAGVSIGFAF